MQRPLLSIAAIAWMMAAAPAAAVECSTYMVGKWIGKGEVELGNTRIKVDSWWTYNADGSHQGVSRYLGQDGVWQEQPSEGRWTAKVGPNPNECVVTVTNGSFSGTTNYEIVDNDTYRSFGLDIRREK